MRSNISPRFTKLEIEVKTEIDKTIISLEADHTADIEFNHIEAEEIIIEIIDQIIEVGHKTIIDMMIGEIITDKIKDEALIGKNIEEMITETTIGQIMEETIIGKGEIEPEVKVGKIL